MEIIKKVILLLNASFLPKAWQAHRYISIMKKIGFKNFRRFKEFNPIELGDITFLVGRNNSGKSTLVKAILLIVDYFKHQKVGVFPFDEKVLNDANVVSFKRTLYNKAEENLITFFLTIRNFNCEIAITGNSNDTKAKVTSLKLNAINDGLIVDFNFLGKPLIKIKRSYASNIIKEDVLKEAEDKLKELMDEVKKRKEEEDVINFIKFNDKALAQSKRISEYRSVNKKTYRNYEIAYELPSADQNSLSEIIYDVIRLNTEAKRESKNKALDKVVAIQNLETDSKLIMDKIKIFSNHLSKFELSYFGADSHKQSALLSIKENNNTLTKALHNYYQLKIQEGSEEYCFVKEWMNVFEIGDDFDIECYEGEVYKLSVYENDPKKEYPINIADKGMGSLQAMKLILEVIPTISQFVKDIKKGNTPKVYSLIIEEPELNLHPKLQSLLADFFYKVNEKYDIRFIIETHSEYIIRKTQLIVAKNELLNQENPEFDVNPFKVYYFHKEKGPYDMIYQVGGKFEKKFGEGFFDVSDKNEIEMYNYNSRS